MSTWRYDLVLGNQTRGDSFSKPRIVYRDIEKWAKIKYLQGNYYLEIIFASAFLLIPFTKTTITIATVERIKPFLPAYSVVVLALCFSRNDEFPVKHTRALFMNGCVHLPWVSKVIRAAYIQGMQIAHYRANMVILIGTVPPQIENSSGMYLAFGITKV